MKTFIRPKMVRRKGRSSIHFIPMVIGFLFLLPISVSAQEQSSWKFAAEANLYLIPDESYLNPILAADHNRLHLEFRYNYEDLETASVFGGYSFQTGDVLELNVTPVVGLVLGNSDGIAPGALLDLGYKKLSISNEFEYFLSFEEKESNFFYAWSEIVYSLKDWIWFGIAGQRTRAFESDLEIQRGFLLGFGYNNFELSGYVMNPGLDDSFGLITVGYTF
jgi:hypothetical protein